MPQPDGMATTGNQLGRSPEHPGDVCLCGHLRSVHRAGSADGRSVRAICYLCEDLEGACEAFDRDKTAAEAASGPATAEDLRGGDVQTYCACSSPSCELCHPPSLKETPSATAAAARSSNPGSIGDLLAELAQNDIDRPDRTGAVLTDLVAEEPALSVREEQRFVSASGAPGPGAYADVYADVYVSAPADPARDIAKRLGELPGGELKVLEGECRSCVFFSPTPATIQLEGAGRCRRHAPAVNGFPAVLPTAWCGDFKSKLG